MADETSTEPTPENLRGNCHPFCISKPELRCDLCAEWLATAGLIESQQARIDELEAALHDLVEFVPGHHLSHADHDHDCYELRCLNIDNARFVLAESPDTPETRP